MVEREHRLHGYDQVPARSCRWTRGGRVELTTWYVVDYVLIMTKNTFTATSEEIPLSQQHQMDMQC